MSKSGTGGGTGHDLATGDAGAMAGRRQAGDALGLCLAVLALTKALAGVAGSFGDLPPEPPFPYWVNLLLILCFGLTGSLLTAGGRTDLRAVRLGVFYLVIATLYAERLLVGLETLAGPLRPAVHLLQHMELDAFLPLYALLFARDFPDARLTPAGEKLMWWLVVAAAAIAAVLFPANLLVLWVDWVPLTVLEREGVGFLFFLVTLPLFVVALILIAWRARRAGRRERRRVAVFAAGIVLGFGPIVLAALMEILVPGFKQAQARPPLRQILQVTLFGLLASVPFTTAYAVLVHQVLNVRLIARRALQYALARGSTYAVASVPFAALLVFLVEHRDRTVAEVLSGPNLVILIVASGFGVAAARYRRALLDAIDRRFFREQYDARQLLTLLVDRIRSARDAAEVADLLAAGVDRALHLEAVALLVEDRAAGLLADPLGQTRPLDPSSALAHLVASSSEPLAVDLEASRSPLRSLPEEDRHWLADGGFRLLVPVVAMDGELLGVIALGGKRSGLPFLRDDRVLLATIAASVALALEARRSRGVRAGHREDGRSPGSLPSERPARECPACGRLFLPHAGACSVCDDLLDPALVPYVLPGKFRFERRLGFGGMGAVYQAVDLALGRPVAVKTLLRVSPEDAVGLRREARTAAAVEHPNLAFVYGLETWRGTPLLILEFLPGGTLARLLEARSLSPEEAVDLGIAMAAALEHLHGADILHRDVKPSNIGFTRNRIPKLMDFGIARHRFDSRPEARGSSPGDPAGSGKSGESTLLHTAADSSRRLVGTLLYTAPEIVEGAEPGPFADLWSLSLVLYECLTAERPFEDEDAAAIMKNVRRAEIPEVRRRRPDCPQVLAELFGRALHRDRSQRPASAGELRRQLEEVRFKMMA